MAAEHRREPGRPMVTTALYGQTVGFNPMNGPVFCNLKVFVFHLIFKCFLQETSIYTQEFVLSQMAGVPHSQCKIIILICLQLLFHLQK